MWRLIKALVFGVIAAAVGAALYFAILKLTGYEFALIAILVGIMVGIAVRAGSAQRGGWLYQIMAVVLTYLAIVTTYVPMIYAEGKEQAIQEARQRLATAPAEAEADMAGLVRVDGENVTLTGAHKGMLMVISFVIAIMAPVLEFNPIGYLIIGVGLYEAGKITRKAKLNIAGPFTVGPEASHAPPIQVPTT